MNLIDVLDKLPYRIQGKRNFSNEPIYYLTIIKQRKGYLCGYWREYNWLKSYTSKSLEGCLTKLWLWWKQDYRYKLEIKHPLKDDGFYSPKKEFAHPE